MITIAVCDDNALFLVEVSRQIAAVLEEAGIAFRLSQFTGGGQLLAAPPFELVFLDVEMAPPDGLETARRLRDRGDRSKLVFLTSHKQYVFSAFDVEASQYLLKPPDSQKLREVLLRLCAKAGEEEERFLTVKQGTGICKISLNQILYIEVLGRKITLHTPDKKWDFYGKLEQLEETLPDSFFRCHRSFVVNLAYVSRYDKTTAMMENGDEVPIAKRKYPAFGKAFLTFLRDGGGHG